MRRAFLTVLVLFQMLLLGSLPVFAEESAEAEENAAPPLRTWVVSQEGRGDFTTIQAAIDAASDHDTIRVTPGTYEECLKAAGKILNIEGDNPYSCVVRCPGFDYHNPALEMSCGTLRNLTLRTYDDGQTSGDGTFGYCLHTDYDHQTGRDLYVENCHFISECGACAGIGLRPHYTLEFNNCTFDSRNAQGAVFCHDYEPADAESSPDLTGQRLIIRDCTLTDSASSPAVIRFQSQELGEAVAEVTFQRNIVTGAEAGSCLYMSLYEGRNIGGGHFLGSSDWVLTPVSAMNSDGSMNSAAP